MTSFLATYHAVSAHPLVHAWGGAVVLFLVLGGGFVLARHMVLNHLARLASHTTSHWDDALVSALESVRPSMYWTLAFLIAAQTLALPEALHTAIVVIFALTVTHYIVQSIGVGAEKLAQHLAARDGDDATHHARAAMGLITGILKMLIWVGSLLFVVSNFGVDITSLIAGLGIGGIAVALALQGILKDLFSSFSIFFDKPFTIGDFIEIGDYSGTVQKIGIKTTRLKSLSGEEVIISNQDLTTATVRNFKRMQERRIVQTIGVTYETPQEMLARIPALIEEVIAGVEQVRFSRAHLRSFGDSALDFEIVYFVESRDYRLSMDVREKINLGILATFAAHGVDIAYPTRVVYNK